MLSSFFPKSQVEKRRNTKTRSKIIRWFCCLVLYPIPLFLFILFVFSCVAFRETAALAKKLFVDIHMHTKNRFRYYGNIFICRPQTSINNKIISHNLLRNRPCQKEYRFVFIWLFVFSFRNHLQFFDETSEQITTNDIFTAFYIQRIISRFGKKKEEKIGLFLCFVFRRNDETCTQVLRIRLYSKWHRQPICFYSIPCSIYKVNVCS